MSDPRRAANRPAVEPIVSISRPVAGVVLVSVQGILSGSALLACRRMIDDVLALEVTDVVLDLGRARCDVTAVPVLSLMRRCAARHGVRLGLSSTSRGALALLRREHLADRFPVMTVPIRSLDDGSRAAS